MARSRRWRTAGLTTKLIVPFALTLLVMAAGLATLSISSSRRDMLDSLGLRARILTQALAGAIGDAAVSNHHRLQELIDDAHKADPDLTYAIVVDTEGKAIGSTDKGLVGKSLVGNDFERSLLKVEKLDRRAVPDKPGVFETVAPVNYLLLGRVGTLRVGFSTAGIDAAARRGAIQAAVAALLALAVAGVLCVSITRRLVRPVRDAAQRLRELASGSADLTQRLEVRSQDEIGILAESFNTFVGKLAGIIGSVRLTATQVTGASQQLSSATGHLAAGTQEQAASLEESAASLEEITATVKQNADNAQQASQLASGSREAAERGGQVVAAAVTSMQELTQASRKIADIITVIDDIAFQTNLLALNAAVEAARAGEQGRGFAVVAAEVRNLAQRSAGAAKEIKGLIQDSVGKVQDGAALVNKSGETLQDIVQSAKRVADIVAEIAAACQEQSGGIDQVNRAVAEMDRLTQDNAAQTEELSSTSEALAAQAHDMLTLVGRFTLPDGDAETTRSPIAEAHPATPRIPNAVRPQPARLEAPAVGGQGRDHRDGWGRLVAAGSSRGSQVRDDAFEEF